jgi:hypothetical protein
MPKSLFGAGRLIAQRAGEFTLVTIAVHGGRLPPP